MSLINHLKNSFGSRTRLVTSVLTALATVASIASVSGCSEASLTREYKSYDYFGRVSETASLSVGVESTKMDIKIPEAYGNIPPHPNDPPSKTRRVDLRSGNFLSVPVGISISPFPDNFVENFRLGYTAVFPDTDIANQIRDGLSKMEWYEYGAYAGTYSRVEVPTIIHSLRASWRQPIPIGGIGFFVEPGVALDLWSADIRGGWDRNYKEQPMFNDKLSCQNINPFVHVGLYTFKGTDDDYSGAINFYWKQENISGSTNKGDVQLKGTTFGLEVRVGF